MPEVLTPVKTYCATYTCDSCGTGNMVRTTPKLVKTCHPPLYEHTCDSCGAKANLRREYPAINYGDAPAETPPAQEDEFAY